MAKWEPGQSGNLKGRPPMGEAVADLMREHLKGKGKGQKITRMEQFVRKVFELALKGDINAIKLIWNYLDGLPNQNLTHDGQIDHVISFSEVLKAIRDDQGTNLKLKEGS